MTMTTKDLAQTGMNGESKYNYHQEEALHSLRELAIDESCIEEKEEAKARSLATENLEHSYNLESNQSVSETNNSAIAPWGQHLVLDLGGCNDNILTKQGIAKFVQELVEAIDMVAYGEPQIVHFAEHSYEAAGYSLVQLIETSAIMGHFSDHNRDAYLDIFSCKQFSNETAIDVVKKHFAPTKIKYTCLDRGINLQRSLLQEVG
jgi:S-adenosylmethionine/arginine decarboxylase-like enzyme